jgi:acetylxylan esterase
VWTCTGKAPQAITFTASGELQVKGKCVSVPNEVLLEPCAGNAAQTWTRHGNGEYILKSNGQCLTDPNNSKTNGTQLRVSACKNTAGQHWSLP